MWDGKSQAACAQMLMGALAALAALAAGEASPYAVNSVQVTLLTMATLTMALLTKVLLTMTILTMILLTTANSMQAAIWVQLRPNPDPNPNPNPYPNQAAIWVQPVIAALVCLGRGDESGAVRQQGQSGLA